MDSLNSRISDFEILGRKLGVQINNYPQERNAQHCGEKRTKWVPVWIPVVQFARSMSNAKKSKVSIEGINQMQMKIRNLSTSYIQRNTSENSNCQLQKVNSIWHLRRKSGYKRRLVPNDPEVISSLPFEFQNKRQLFPLPADSVIQRSCSEALNREKINCTRCPKNLNNGEKSNERRGVIEAQSCQETILVESETEDIELNVGKQISNEAIQKIMNNKNIDNCFSSKNYNFEEDKQINNTIEEEKMTDLNYFSKMRSLKEIYTNLKSKDRWGSANKCPIAFNNSSHCLESLALRCDVVYKTIMRSLRRFYQDKYKDSTNKYCDQESLNFYLNLKSFSEKLQRHHCLSDQSVPKLMIYLGSIMFPKSVLKMVCNGKPGLTECEELANIKEESNKKMQQDSYSKDIDFSKMKINIKNILSFHDCLYNFSMKKVLNLVTDPVISKLLKIYYEDILLNPSQVPNVMSKNMEIYKKAFKTLENSICTFKLKSVLFFE